MGAVTANSRGRRRPPRNAKPWVGRRMPTNLGAIDFVRLAIDSLTLDASAEWMGVQRVVNELREMTDATKFSQICQEAARQETVGIRGMIAQELRRAREAEREWWRNNPRCRVRTVSGGLPGLGAR